MASAKALVTPAERTAYILGSQGPDPLFMLGIFPLRPSSKPLKLGNVLHSSRTGAFLTALLSEARKGNPVQRAFALGFLTHYALDSTVHPYVYSQSIDKKGRYSSPLHLRLEKHWDTLYLLRDGGHGTPVMTPGVLDAKPHWQAIAAVWASAAQTVYPEQGFTPELIEKSFGDAVRVCRLTHSPHGVKYGTFWVLERIIGKPALITSQMCPVIPSRKDITNTEGRPWRAPSQPGIERREGLDQLFGVAVSRAAELLRAAGSYFDRDLDEKALAAIIGNVGYDTGMESQP